MTATLARPPVKSCRRWLPACGVAMTMLTSTMLGTAYAEPTEIVVRAISRDAKFIGDSMGGVRIVLRDAQSGHVLAEGITSGGTGDTKRLMETGKRREPLATPEAADFRATIDIDQPRLVQLEAYGPLGQLQSAITVTSQQWILPGKHVRDGNGWMVEMPGFVVDILDPAAASTLKLPNVEVRLRANVVMMCGCPTSPGGLWDASRFQITATIHRDGKAFVERPLTYSGTTSQYELSLNLDAPGLYGVIVQAYDANTGNAGVDRTSFTVTAK
ncbi:MAG TPA: hypothetical protein PLN33_05445 [Hyphomonadaceae bacterium]|jgi:hypothetical protein|nr:hypothetical protein [Hyphomonadaceae bacterium]